MNRDQVKTVMNSKLSRFLYKARKQSKQSPAQIAAALGVTESTLKDMEQKPAEVPCRELYRLLELYGPQQMHRAQLVLVNAQASLRANRKRNFLLMGLEQIKRLEFRFLRWEGLAISSGGRLCLDCVRFLAGLVIFREKTR